MEYLNKTFKNRVTGDIFQIIDVYQNIAITSNKEKINTNLLADEKFFIPVGAPPKSINESMRNIKDDSVDPNKFFSSQTTYNAFADQIKKLPLDKVPFEDTNNGSIKMTDLYGNLPIATNESAIIMSDPEDEIEELKRKYGATSVDSSIQKQNESFARFFQDETPTEQVERVEVQRDTPVQNNFQVENIQSTMTQNETIQRIEALDPVTQMFKNVKRNTNFNLSFKVNGKIPRLDFIEMMEDSYEISIIEYLADEFTRNILNDPSEIRNKIIQEIKSMIEKNSQSKDTSNSVEVEKTTAQKSTKRTSTRKKNVSE
jgi:hypothetical protein